MGFLSLFLLITEYLIIVCMAFSIMNITKINLKMKLK